MQRTLRNGVFGENLTTSGLMVNEAVIGEHWRVGQDAVEILHRPDHDVTVALAFRALTREPDLLPRIPAAKALPQDVKEMVRRRLGK